VRLAASASRAPGKSEIVPFGADQEYLIALRGNSEVFECRAGMVGEWQHHTISDVRREFLPKKPFFRSRFFARRGGRNVGRLAHALSLP